MASLASKAKQYNGALCTCLISSKQSPILLFAFIIISILQAVPAQTNAPQHLLSKKLREVPKPSKVKLISRSGTRTVNSELAIYWVTFPSKQQQDFGVVVFRDDQTKQLWVGEMHELYVSTKHGIAGFSFGTGVIFGSKEMLKIDSASTLTNMSDIWKMVDEKITPEMLTAFHPLNFYGALGEEFFQLTPTSSGVGVPRVNKVSVLDNEEIQLDLSSPSGDHNAIATFDDQTLDLKRLILDGKQVFPK